MLCFPACFVSLSNCTEQNRIDLPHIEMEIWTFVSSQQHIQCREDEKIYVLKRNTEIKTIYNLSTKLNRLYKNEVFYCLAEVQKGELVSPADS